MQKHYESHENTYSDPFGTHSSNNDEQRKKMKQIVKAIIETQLTDRQKEIMILHYADGMTMSEIGQLLGISKMSVSRRVRAATKRINKIKKIFKSVTL
ncbi:MAG: sigma-70 family RNA polymerase sigma factor [Candidatus Paceibacterota bacterium]|jgi:RNA polymerase sigma factor (sigma-70 family)